MKKKLLKNWYQLFGAMLLFLPWSSGFSQTTLIDPALGGGFELGSSFSANGWTVVNYGASTNNNWYVGAPSTPFAGTNAAYVSNDGGTTYTYSNSTISTTHFYQDVTVPAGESVINLQFQWKGYGESGWDRLLVYYAPTSVTPVAGTPASNGTTLAGATLLFTQGTFPQNSYTGTSFYLPTSLAGTTFRLIFTWQNDGSFGTAPPASVDNISLTSRVPGSFISVATGNWTTPATWQANAVPSPYDTATVSTGNNVTIDAASLSIAKLTVNGTLDYGTTPSSFGVSGNLNVNTGGIFNVFNGTTGKTLSVGGNITNNGTMDLSVGTTSAGNLTLNGSSVQNVSGTGTFNTSVIRNLVCSNTSTAIPNINWSFNNIKIAYNLNLTGARVNLGTNKLTFGNGATPGTLTAPAGTGFLPGAKFSRYWNTTTLGSTITSGSVPTSTTGLYPFVNNAGESRNAFVRRSTATGSVAGELAVVYTDGTGVTSGLTINDGGYNVSTRYNGNWTFSVEGTPMSSADYILALAGQNAMTLAGTPTNARIVFASTLLPGTHQNGTNYVVAQRTAMTQADILSAPLYIGIGSADYVPMQPGALTEAAGTPTCTAGTTITAAGTPETDVVWYWQATATGTATTDLYNGPYTVFANGTYYLRALDTVSGAWSTTSSTITISNFPTATPPPTPTAAANPACVPGTTISVPAAPSGLEYYWQGTTVNGSSQADPATAPYTVTTTGTYLVASYDVATQCWSPTVGLAVTVDSQIPNDPVVTNSYLNICTGATTAMISGTTSSNSPGSLATTQAGGNGCSGGAMFNLTTNGNPINITSIDVTPNVSGAQNVTVYYKSGTYLGSETASGSWTTIGTYPITAASGTPSNVDIADLLIPASTTYAIYVEYPAQYSNIAAGTTYTTSDLTLTVGAGLCSSFGGVNAGRAFNGTVNYTVPVPATATWFDAASGGNVVGTGSPFETIGTTVLPTATNGSYDFYLASTLGGCYSTNRALVTVNVNPVVVDLDSIDVTCNGMANGSFSLAASSCGTAPFQYSVNGGAYGPIPTNLTAGTYSIVAKDANMDTSAANIIVINEPTAPQNLNAYNVTYYNGYLTWTPQGNETNWVVEYGPAGFTPGTGTTVNATNDTLHITGLTENTNYEFYVQAGCVTNSAWAGPYPFATAPGFLAWDSQCPTIGFYDISGTGTNLNLTDDSEAGVTLPFGFPYQGGTITDLTVGNNGGIQLGTLTGQVGYGGNMTTITGDFLFPWGDDLDDETGDVYWEVIGTAPNRIAIFQWSNSNNFSNGPGTVTFQVQMYETSGEIYYVYDDVIFGGSETADDYAGNADIGLSGPTTDINVSNNNQTYLQNNSCVHFYYALCPNVQNMVVLTYPDDAQLNWDPGLYGETNWTVVYGLEGFDPTVPGQAIDTLQLTSSDTNFGNTLTQLTGYDVYIYSECQADNLTSDGYFVHFVTKPWCADITGLAGVTDPDSLELTWNWTEVTPVYPVTSFNIEYGMYGYQQGTGTLVTANGINFSDTVVDPNLLGSGVYQVYVQAICGGTNDSSNFVGPITVIMPATNDIVCSQEALMLDSLYTFNTTGASVSTNETNIAPPATGAQTNDGWANSTLNGTLWYTFVAPASGQVRVNSTAINFNTQAAIYEATLCSDFNTFSLISANDDAIEGGSSAPNFTACGLTPGQTYYLMFDKFNGTNGNFAVNISEVVLNAGMANPVLNICSGDTINLFSTINNNILGGMWSSAIPSVNANITDSMFASIGLSYTIHNFEYRVVDGCAFDTVVSKVHIYGPSNAGEDGNISACKNEPIDLLSGLNGNADLNGTWYDPSNAQLPNSQITTGNFPGQYNYDYISGNGVCPDDTANVVVTVTSCDWLSVGENTFDNVNVYPNPTTGKLYVSASFDNGSYDLVVTDVNGRVIDVKANAVSADNNMVNLNGVERGTYFVKLSKDNAEKVFRIVVQ